MDSVARVDAGRVVFSRYDRAGKTYEMVAVGVADSLVTTRVDGMRLDSFIAEDSRYLVYTAVGDHPFLLVAYDKLQRRALATIELPGPLRSGHIAGDRLLVPHAWAPQGSMPGVMVYRLPDLALERTVPVAGIRALVPWGDRFVSVGNRLRVHDRELRETASVELPAREADQRHSCESMPVRVSGDRAVFLANCSRLAVVDLRTARIERILPARHSSSGFDVADDLLFVSRSGDASPSVHVIDLSTGRELARIPMRASVLAVQGRWLLSLGSDGYSGPWRFSWHELDYPAIRSEGGRLARMLDGCRAAEQALALSGDLHAAVDSCEMAGIYGYVDEAEQSSEVRGTVITYARWLTRSMSRYAEGAAILERYRGQAANPAVDAGIAVVETKSRYIDANAGDATTSSAQVLTGITRVPIDFGAFPDLFHFDGRRVYVGRWACRHDEKTPGVSLDVLDRRTLARTVRVALLDCDAAQQDSIKSIIILRGMIVLGLEYRFEEAGRPNVMIVDKRSLRLVAKLFVPEGISGLSSWKGRLLACAQGSGRTHQRFDRSSARLVDASASESRACRDGDIVALAPARAFLDNADDIPVGRTPCCDVVATYGGMSNSYRVVDRQSGLVRHVGTPGTQYFRVIVLPDRDALLLLYDSGRRTRVAYYTIEHDSTVDLLELNPTTRTHYGSWWAQYLVVWSRFAFIARDRDLLVYDLDRRTLVRYENDLIREGFINNCCGMDRNGIVRLLLDQGHLLVLTADGANSRVIDLRAYTAALPYGDFFEAADNVEAADN